MTEALEIIPGKSIGPFKLGMTRDQIEGLNIRPMWRLAGGVGVSFPLIAMTEEELARWGADTNPGVTVMYDADRRCSKLLGVFSYDPAGLPRFIMLGQVVNGMTYRAAIELLGSIATDVTRGYGSVFSPSAGVSATKWEASDECIMCVSVERATGGD